MSKHTKGPWQRNIKPARKYPTIFAGRNTHIAQLAPQPSDEEMEANANLIAAAPDLLTVAELGKTMRDAQKAYFKNRTQENLIASKQAEKEFDDAVKAALAKVEG